MGYESERVRELRRRWGIDRPVRLVAAQSIDRIFARGLPPPPHSLEANYPFTQAFVGLLPTALERWFDDAGPLGMLPGSVAASAIEDDARAALQKLVAHDERLGAVPASTQKRTILRNDGSLRVDVERGRYVLTGATDGHLLVSLLRKAGVNARDLGSGVASVIEDLLGSDVDLAEAQRGWRYAARRIAHARLSQDGPRETIEAIVGPVELLRDRSARAARGRRAAPSVAAVTVDAEAPDSWVHRVRSLSLIGGAPFTHVFPSIHSGFRPLAFRRWMAVANRGDRSDAVRSLARRLGRYLEVAHYERHHAADVTRALRGVLQRVEDRAQGRVSPVDVLEALAWSIRSAPFASSTLQHKYSPGAPDGGSGRVRRRSNPTTTDLHRVGDAILDLALAVTGANERHGKLRPKRTWGARFLAEFIPAAEAAEHRSRGAAGRRGALTFGDGIASARRVAEYLGVPSRSLERVHGALLNVFGHKKQRDDLEVLWSALDWLDAHGLRIAWVEAQAYQASDRLERVERLLGDHPNSSRAWRAHDAAEQMVSGLVEEALFWVWQGAVSTPHFGFPSPVSNAGYVLRAS